MQRIRAARAIAEHYKSIDPETMITENLIRRLMEAGKLPVFMNGTKKLTSIEAVDNYIDAQLGGTKGNAESDS